MFHILVSKKHNFWNLSITEVVVVWRIASKVVINWASVVIYHMIEDKRNNIWLSYGSLITKIWEHVDFNLEDKEPGQEYIGMGNNTIYQMKIDINNVVLSYKSSK